MTLGGFFFLSGTQIVHKCSSNRVKNPFKDIGWKSYDLIVSAIGAF